MTDPQIIIPNNVVVMNCDSVHCSSQLTNYLCNTFSIFQNQHDDRASTLPISLQVYRLDARQYVIRF